jgi:antitoxin component of MazEF toxin-antitoxin module
MKRKLVQIGSSLAVTLPAEVVREFRLKKGQSVEVNVHPLTGVVSIKAGLKYFEEGKVTRQFRRKLAETLAKYDSAFERLSK